MLDIKEKLKPNDSKLKTRYLEALKDEGFKNFIGKIKLDDEILMKYTSILEESYSEFNNCLNCSNICACKNKMVGYTYLPKIVNGKLQFDYKICRYKKQNDKKTSHLKNIKFYNLPSALMDADWDKVDNRLLKRKDTILWLNNFINGYPDVSKGLYLSGNFGCGKTYLIVAAFNELAKKNIKSAVVFWPEFLRDLKASFDSDYADKVEYIKKVPLLLIDDLGAETTTSWARDEILCSILQYRMDEQLLTFITSNLTIENMADHLAITNNGNEEVKAKRIVERILQLTEQVEMISKNLRN